MSAFGGKADMASAAQNVREWHKADVARLPINVRLQPDAAVENWMKGVVDVPFIAASAGDVGAISGLPADCRSTQPISMQVATSRLSLRLSPNHTYRSRSAV